jgi:HAE1 family hydrophobic/amphiphilic exporter-1
MSLPRLSIRRPIAVAMLFLAVVLLGLISFRRLPIELLPDVAFPRLVVYTSDPGAAPAEIERFVSAPVEQAVSTVPGVQEVESISREGVSLVTVRFAWGTDMDFAALGVREKLDGLRGTLPELASRPAVLRVDPRSEPIMALSVAGGQDIYALGQLAENVFRRRLEQIDGVARAAVTGGLEREIHVEVDPRRLESYGLSVVDVTRALDAANASAPVGTVRQGRYRYALRTLGELAGTEEIGGVPVRRSGGAAGTAGLDPAGDAPASADLTLRDVARIEDGFREREAIARYSSAVHDPDAPDSTGERRGAESIGLLIFKNSDANTVRVAERVEATLEELRAQYPDARLEVAMSQAGFVSDAIDNVVSNLIQGAVLAFLVLLLFLRDARYPVAIALAIPISVIATFALLDAFGVSLNIMSLGGLALGVGMLVDNSIVVLENTFRHRELGAAPEAAATLGAEEVQGAITASTLTTIAVFGPIIYIEGVAGELFGALSLAVAFSLLASLFVALTLLPTLAARYGDRGEGAAGWVRRMGARLFGPGLAAFDRGFARFAAAYERSLGAALRHRGRTLGGALLLLALAVALGLTLERRVLPEVDQGSFRARVELPRGTPLEQTGAVARRLEEVFLADPATEAVFSHAGRQVAVAGIEEEESGLNTATLDVRLREGESTAEVLERLRPRLAGLPPGALALETGEATALGRLMGGGEADLAVQVRGEDLDGALAYARRVEERLATVPSLANVRLGTELGQPEMRLEIDRERAASYGIEPRRIVQTIRTYMYGEVATELAEFDRKVPVVVRLPERDRRSLQTLESLQIDGVPLRELIRVESTLAPAEIRRVAQGRIVAVYADVASGGIDAAVDQVHAALRPLPVPYGLRAEIGGENEEMRRSLRELAFAFGLALLLVYMILAAEFESFVQPVVVLLSVPLGLVGAVLALWLTGAGLNTMSLIGLVILAGIVDNDAVVKIDFINRMRRRGLPLREAILAAGHARLRPILMTTLTTMLGLLPMAVVGGRGAELRAPLAIAIFGGLLSATLLTLIVLPVVYEAVEEGRARVAALARRDSTPLPTEAEAQAIPGD